MMMVVMMTMVMMMIIMMMQTFTFTIRRPSPFGNLFLYHLPTLTFTFGDLYIYLSHHFLPFAFADLYLYHSPTFTFTIRRPSLHLYLDNVPTFTVTFTFRLQVFADTAGGNRASDKNVVLWIASTVNQNSQPALIAEADLLKQMGQAVGVVGVGLDPTVSENLVSSKISDSLNETSVSLKETSDS
jgi:hypothetical protein